MWISYCYFEAIHKCFEDMLNFWRLGYSGILQIDLHEDEMLSDGALLDAKEVEFENLSGEDDENLLSEESAFENHFGEDDKSVLSEASSHDKNSQEIGLSRAAGDDDTALPRQSVEEPENEDEDYLSELSSVGTTSNSLESSTRLSQTDEQPGPLKRGPDVKTSAVTGVGLQELLELIDEKLKAQDERAKSQHIVERGIFDRKWRPPRDNNAGIAVEQ